MDIADIEKLIPDELAAWLPVLEKYKKNESLTRDEIQECLNSGYPPPAELNPLFSKIVQEVYSFRHPPKYNLDHLTHRLIADAYSDLRDHIKNPECIDPEMGDGYIREMRNLHSKWKLKHSAEELAAGLVAETYGVEPRHVKTVYNEHRQKKMNSIEELLVRENIHIQDPPTSAELLHMANLFRLRERDIKKICRNVLNRKNSNSFFSVRYFSDTLNSMNAPTVNRSVQA